MKTLTGRSINGYRIDKLIAEGSMAEIYKAYPPNGGEPVAMKILEGQPAMENIFRARFMREVKLLQTLKHPNIMPIYDYGISNTAIFFTMPLLRGVSLGDQVRQQPYSLDRAWEVLHPLIDALAYGHHINILHRDVKPDNVLIEQQDSREMVYLTDFGLSKQYNVGQTFTHSGTVFGTPEYSSPEAIMAEHLDVRADLYSLAVTIYEMLLGVLPFDARHAQLIAMAHVNEPPIPPRKRHPDFPAQVEAVLLKGLEKDPNARYPSVEAFGGAFYEAVQTVSSQARTVVYG